MFTNLEESDFFTKSEYEYIKHEFNFEALAKLTSKEFAVEIERVVSWNHIKKFVYEEGEEHFFLWFYAEDGVEADKFLIIRAYHNKKDYFSVNTINYSDFHELGLDVSINHK